MHPILAKIGPLTFYSYGMMVAIAYLVGIYIAKKEVLRKDMPPALVYDLAFYLIIGSLTGARIYYVIFFDPSIFINDPLSILKIWEGGVAIHGAIFGGALAGYIFSRLRKLSFWKIADIVAPSLILGQAIGRIGCFLNGCCFGVPTKSIFGIRFPESSPANMAYGGLPVHPTQAYEAFLDAIGFAILYFLRKRIKFNGGVFLLYLIAYGAIRIVVSGFRGDSLYIWNTNIKIAQVVSAAIIILASAIFMMKKSGGKG